MASEASKPRLSLSEVTFGATQPNIPLSNRSAAHRLRRMETDRVLSANKRRQMLSLEEENLLIEKKAVILKGDSMTSQALLATRLGMINVSKRELKLKPQGLILVSVQPVRGQRRGSVSLSLYDSILNDDFAKYVAHSANIHMPEHHNTRHFSVAEIGAILRIHTEQINSSCSTRRDYFRKLNRCGYFYDNVEKCVRLVTLYRYEKFVQYFKPDPITLFNLVSKSFISSLQTWPTDLSWIYIAADESMIVWTAGHNWVLWIPRKPNPKGMRVFFAATILTATGRPIVLWMWPDLPPDEHSFMSPKTVMEKVAKVLREAAQQQLLPRNYTITMDALFSYPDMLKSWLASNIYGSIGIKENKLITALAYMLPKHHHRIFKLGDVLISIYRDRKVFTIASTIHTVKEESKYIVPQAPLMSVYSTDMLFLLSLAGSTPALQNDLRMLCTMGSTKTQSSNTNALIATASHLSKVAFEEILAREKPSSQLLAAMKDFVFQHSTNVNDIPSIIEPVVNVVRKPGSKMSSEDVQCHKQLLVILKKQNIANESFKPNQKVVGMPQLKRVLKKLNINLPENFKTREEKVKYTIQWLEREAGNNNVDGIGEAEGVSGEIRITDATDDIDVTGIVNDNTNQTDEGSDDISIEVDNLDERWKDLLPSLTDISDMYTTKKELKAGLVHLFSGVKLGGNKEDLIKRLRALRSKMLLDPSFAHKVLIDRMGKGKPTTMIFHGNTFNFVDRIDIMLAFLEFGFKFEEPWLVLLIYLQRLVEVNTHSYVENEKWDWEGFDLNRYHDDANYKKNLYKKERKCIKDFHKELLEGILILYYAMCFILNIYNAFYLFNFYIQQ